MTRAPQIILIAATLAGSWLAMQAIHESGHVLAGWVTGGRVEQVVLHPLAISRTDAAPDPRPLAVAWAGPIFGAIVPLLLWGAATAARLPGAFVWRFFAGFCLLANGLYIGLGSFGRVGDAGDLLRHGAAQWQLWLFGIATAPAGLALWHGQGPHFGFGRAQGQVHRGVACGTLLVCLALAALGFAIGGK